MLRHMTARADRSARAPSRSDEDVRLFVERLGSTLTDAGLPRLPARVFAALLADEDGRMTSAQLAEALDVSAASISGAVRYLAQVHLLHREREAGSRRDVYVIRDDAWHDAMINTRRTYAPILWAVGQGVAAVGGPQTGAGRRLATTVEFLQFITDEMEAAGRRWDERRRQLGL
jgi:MarR family